MKPNTSISKNRKQILNYATGKGKMTCEFCEKRIYHHNIKRHYTSKSHIQKTQKYANENNKIIFQNIGEPFAKMFYPKTQTA